ncbi:MAG: arylsulfatase [Phycisphaerae bacterium]|nr:arylsulfatase [Phycisphaerae bacterium]
MFKMKLFITASLFCCAGFALAGSKQLRPNIIYILADDMGYGDVSCLNENSMIQTPNLDRMASEGMYFSDAHTNSSVCTPTRYGILTGRYSWRTKLKKGVLGGHSRHLIKPGRETVASLLKKQGYATACFGKWHLGMDWASTDGKELKKSGAKNVDFTKPITKGPLDVGFDHYFGISASLNMDPHAFVEDRMIDGDVEYVATGDEIKARGLIGAKPGWVADGFEQDQVLSTFANKSADWIRTHQVKNPDQPFFIYMPLNSPHSPIVPSKDFKDKSGLSPHGDFCMETDWAVGRVVDTVDKLGIADNTLIIFTADNGTSPMAKLDRMQAQGHYSMYIYRGLKGSLNEGGHRVPFIARWPKVVKPDSSSSDIICTTDLMATVAEITGVKLDDNAGEDSVSFYKALKGKKIKGNDSRGVVHHSDSGIFSIRRGKWKLIFDSNGGTRRNNPKDKPVKNPAKYHLFDMENDAVESTNLYDKYPEVVKELKMLLADFINKGRSTPGTKQQNEPAAKNWNQIDVVKEYLK